MVSICTPIPGPRSRALWKRKRRFVSRSVFSEHPIFARYAKNEFIEDVDGNHFFDFACGLGANNAGHSQPTLLKAMASQAKRFVHTAFQSIPYKEYVDVCERLVGLARVKKEGKALLLNSGAEAIENAVKLARFYTRKKGVACLDAAFHGRTLFALSITAKTTPYKQGFGPFFENVHMLPTPYVYRRPEGFSEKEYVSEKIQQAQAFFEEQDVACTLVEPVLGEGGFIPLPLNYLKALKRFSKRYGFLLVVDEVQTGFCRTGKTFAIHRAGVEPDLLCCAKSIAGGLPLSGVVGRSEILDAPPSGGLGGTFAGNPVSCAAALAFFDFIIQRKLNQRAERIGRTVRRTLKKLQDEVSIVGDARGVGAMNALELVVDKDSKKPNPEKTKQIVRTAREKGLLLLHAGMYDNVVRTFPPLVIGQRPLEEALYILDNVVRAP